MARHRAASSAGADARRALQGGDLPEASRLAAVAAPSSCDQHATSTCLVPPRRPADASPPSGLRGYAIRAV